MSILGISVDLFAQLPEEDPKISELAQRLSGETICSTLQGELFIAAAKVNGAVGATLLLFGTVPKPFIIEGFRIALLDKNLQFMDSSLATLSDKSLEEAADLAKENGYLELEAYLRSRIEYHGVKTLLRNISQPEPFLEPHDFEIVTKPDPRVLDEIAPSTGIFAAIVWRIYRTAQRIVRA